MYIYIIGAGTIAGAQGTMWTTILQIGKLVDTAQRVRLLLLFTSKNI